MERRALTARAARPFEGKGVSALAWVTMLFSMGCSGVAPTADATAVASQGPGTPGASAPGGCSYEEGGHLIDDLPTSVLGVDVVWTIMPSAQWPVQVFDIIDLAREHGMQHPPLALTPAAALPGSAQLRAYLLPLADLDAMKPALADLLDHRDAVVDGRQVLARRSGERTGYAYADCDVLFEIGSDVEEEAREILLTLPATSIGKG